MSLVTSVCYWELDFCSCWIKALGHMKYYSSEQVALSMRETSFSTHVT